MLLTDIPYLTPLWLWLRADEDLKLQFTEKSFFMPKHNLISATEEAMKKDCPAPRALWILPQDTLAVGRKSDCKVPGVHTFYVELIVQCIRDPFEIYKDGDTVTLGGQYMELMGLRRLVKQSVLKFSKANSENTKFSDLFWVKDTMLYPSDESPFLITAIQFEIKIY